MLSARFRQNSKNQQTTKRGQPVVEQQKQQLNLADWQGRREIQARYEKRAGLRPDVTFREDESRVRDRFAADNLVWLKRFAISLLEQQTDKESIAMRRRMAGWNIDYLMQVLALKTI